MKSVIFKPDNKTTELMVSGRCTFNCPGCVKMKAEYFELSTKEWRETLKKLKKIGIKNVIFGGAEPLMRTDIIELARYAKKVGLKCALTTNGKTLYDYDCDDLRNFEYIVISWHRKAVIFERSLLQLKQCGIPSVISYTYDRRHENDLEYLKHCSHIYDAELCFHCYEPVGINDFDNRIPFEDVIKVVEKTKKEGYQVSFR